MFGFNVKVLHLESTSICNAKCPQCPRENPLFFNKKQSKNLSLSKCKEIFSPVFIKQLNKMFMCGNFGDPVASKYTLDIIRYFKKHNKNITIGLNTNGSIQNPKWWKELAHILTNDTDYVVFSIDGLEDTNHIYRKNVNWNKLMDNVTAYINAGGKAHWDMLIFEHNEHQVREAEILAYHLGFTWFRTKISKRFSQTATNQLKPPVRLNLPNTHHTESIKCHAHNEKSIYVSATGKILPCCWIGVYEFINDPILKKMLNTPNWNGLINSWSDTPHNVCLNNCGTSIKNKTNFEEQWNKEIQLR